jgi:hypothetical protein
MATASTLGERFRASRHPRCGECGAGLAYCQRYCLECGARHGPLPRAIAERIGVASPAERGSSHQAAAERHPSERRPSERAVDADRRAPGSRGSATMLSPAAGAVAVMALLAFGVLVGSAVSPVQESGAAAPLVVAVSASPAASSPTPGPPTSTPPPSRAPEAVGASASTGATPESTSGTTPTSRTPASTKPAGGTKRPSQATGGPTKPSLPPIAHAFLIALSDQGSGAAFGPSSPAPYLAKTLTGQGELFDSYYAVAGGELANEIALISGQGPTPQTAASCPLYTDIAPGTLGAQGQVLGSGCVYPRQALTLGDQLADDGRTWKAYVEGIGNGGPGQPAACRHPTPGNADANQTPSPEDPYVTWRDPFVYFHSVIDSPACAGSVVGLEQLAPDLAGASRTPSFAYIVPDRCHDGSEEPCAPGQPGGLAAADAFLRKAVPEIESSPAYKTGGLIAITFDQAPQSGPGADTSGCCITSPYPNLPTGAPGTAATPVTTTTPTTTPVPGTAPNTTATTPAATTPSTTPSTGAPAAATSTQPGGGRVGLLLISRYVKPGSVNVTGDYDHFSLLASIENLFGLSHLGYAGAQGLLTFDASVYNNYP